MILLNHVCLYMNMLNSIVIRRYRIIYVFLLFLALPAFSENLAVNGSFRESTIADDSWDGVDKDLNLRVNSIGLPILISGSFQVNKDFGASPAWKDVTGDGKPDLVVGDGPGFLWIFETTSRKSAFPPEFSQGRFVHSFLGQAANIDVADYNDDGLNDVLAGTVEGAVQILKNKGNAEFLDADSMPSYVYMQRKELRSRMPVDITRIFPLVMKGDKPLFVGSFLAPRLIDWNGDGKNDLVVGEGSYSANSVYFFKNFGQNSNPDFTASTRHWLAYGMGREQLSPAVGDLDGDGDLDLLVGDRLGELTWYENAPQFRTNSSPFLTEPKTKLTVGGSAVPAGEFVRPYLADVDNDGLLDLFLGANDGRILLSRNLGSRSQPNFGPAAPLKGVDRYKPRKIPPQPWHQFQLAYGNTAATYETREETDLVTGSNRVFVRLFLRDGYFGVPSTFEMSGLEIEYGKDYSLKFMFRGNNATATAGIGQHGEAYIQGDKRERKYGGGTSYPLTLGIEWRQFQKTFKLDKLVQDRKENYANCWIYFHLDSCLPDGYFDISDVSLEKITL